MHVLPQEHQSDLDALAQTYWWHVHRIQTVSWLMSRYGRETLSAGLRYLDIGGGTGATTGEIAKALSVIFHQPLSSSDVHCMEGDTGLKEFQKNRAITFHTADLEQPWNFRESPFNVFTALDVLEHVADPIQVLKQVRQHLVPQSIGVVTVPAFMFLYSEWDHQLNHLRRYTRNDLRKECEAAGFRLVWCSYLFSYAFPFAWMARRFPRDNSQ